MKETVELHVVIKEKEKKIKETRSGTYVKMK